MKPIYIITRYDEHGEIIWERLSRSKQGYYSTIGSINSFGKRTDEVTLDEVTISSQTTIAHFHNGAEVTP